MKTISGSRLLPYKLQYSINVTFYDKNYITNKKHNLKTLFLKYKIIFKTTHVH